MTIYKLFSLGQLPLTDRLISEGYGNTSGGPCDKCRKPLKRYPWYNEVDNRRLCGLCYMAEIETSIIPGGISSDDLIRAALSGQVDMMREYQSFMGKPVADKETAKVSISTAVVTCGGHCGESGD